MFSYEGLNALLHSKGINKSALAAELGISSRTIAKIAKGEKLSNITLKKIADYLGTEPAMLCREVSDNPILQLLRDEKSHGISGGLYHELQVRMTYNSNHIEGSKLTEDHTRMIFETNTIGFPEGIPVDDILETVHHFRAIDYVIIDVHGMTPYSGRHTFATNMSRSGVPIKAAMAVMGHKDERMLLRRYIHSDDSDVTEAVNAVTEYIRH